MKGSTKVILGILAGAAAGVAVGLAISDSELGQDIKATLAEAGDQLNLKVQDMIDNSRDYLGDLKDKLAEGTELDRLVNTEG